MSERAPLVSTVIPVYNGASYIEEALRSVFGQTYPNIEVIVVDDASTDETPSILKKHESRVTVVRRPANGGVSSCRNVGITASRGDLIAFLDSDDLWLPDHVARGAEAFFGHREVGLVAVNTLVENERAGTRSVIWTKVVRTGAPVTERLLRENFICTSSAMASRRALDVVGLFDEAFPAAEDYDLWYRIARHFEVVVVEEPLTVWRYRSSSFSSDSGRMIENVIHFYDKVLSIEESEEERAIAAERRLRCLFKLGIAQSLAGNDSAAKETFAKVVAEGAPSLEARIAIALHAVSPALFKVVRRLRGGRGTDVLAGMELVI
ncbi:MAG: glycosyltransferase [Chloroflexi bacterium]|nr:glycosyltransferase [Chloroflexota bacterium]